MGRLFNPCGAGGVSPRDRYKFCGSLPNHLDEKEQCRGDGTPESLYSGNNNYGEVYGAGVDLVLNKLGSDGVVGDQGYSSERSPEEELPPSIPNYQIFMEFPFITKGTCSGGLLNDFLIFQRLVFGGVQNMQFCC